MKTPVYNQKAEVIGEVELNPKIFEVKSNRNLIAEIVRILLSNARQGTSSTKTRSEVRGGGKKPWKQKGTGRARVGSIRSPIWRHGGVTFGPRADRNWKLKVNKKAKQKALLMSLSDRAAGSQLIVINKINLEKPKTKEFSSVLSAFKGSIKDLGKKQVFLLGKRDEKLIRASRNLSSVKSVLAKDLNLLDVLSADSMLILQEALPVLEKQYLKKSET